MSRPSAQHALITYMAEKGPHTAIVTDLETYDDWVSFVGLVSHGDVGKYEHVFWVPLHNVLQVRELPGTRPPEVRDEQPATRRLSAHDPRQ